MTSTVLLDAGPLGMITNPKSSVETEDCKTWLAAIVMRGAEVVIPEIADYEVRRELIRAERLAGIARLDAFKRMLTYAPITTTVMLKAAEFWARARNIGRQSASDASLDADVILAAHAAIFRYPDACTIATTNVRHLASFVPALHWREIV